MKKMGKWFWAFVGVSVALVIAIVVAIVIGVTGPTADTEPDPIPEGSETGLYYYDAGDIEYTLDMHSGNQFTLYDGVTRVGEYTIENDNITFTFTKESNGSATGTYADGVITMTYNDAEIRFLKKVPYTVSFNTNGGSSVDNATVINGKLVQKPDDPTKEGFVFLGWYGDAELTALYAFDSTAVTADITLYARWAEKVVGQSEYVISFVGADVASMNTIGGKVYNLPVPEKDGYTFGGWWISMYEDADKLTYKCEEEMTLTADTTLFALWIGDAGSRLANPLVQVNANGISWNTVKDASHYAVKITAPNGEVVFDENVSETTMNFDFALAGEYVVSVTAVSSASADKNSDAVVRYYAANTLDRVYRFTVVEPTLLVFNSVANAQKYYINIACGNDDHNHTAIDNGNSTVYNFANCEMKDGGIEFTVTAVADGYASSVSTTFKFERKLDRVSEIAVKGDTLTWLPVANAVGYKLDITCAEHNAHTVVVNATSYDLKNCSGETTVQITPVTEGYVSPEAATFTYTKTTLAAPENVVVNGNVITWNAVKNATGYTVKIGDKSFNVTEARIDLGAVTFTAITGDAFDVTVTAENANGSSAASDKVHVNYLKFAGDLSYANNRVSWTPVIGANAGKYEVKVNNGEIMTVENTDSALITFAEAGVNTIAVRFVSAAYTSDWMTTDVDVYEITLDTRLGSGVGTLYAAFGDSIVLPTTSTRTGFDFAGWYNTARGADGNGKLIVDGVFAERSDVVYYAYWNAKSFNVIYDVESGVNGANTGDTVTATYNSDFTLAVPTSDTGSFVGWFTGRDGSGIQITGSDGKSLSKFMFLNDITVYPSFETGALSYVERNDGTWAVTQGPMIASVSDLIIPETYQGKTVTVILENAFSGCSNLKTISIPNTVSLVGTGAFATCSNLESIDVRVIEGGHEVVYSSSDGVLIRNDYGTRYLEFFPRGKSGTYTVPDTVDSIRTKAFQYAKKLEKVVISENVTYIADTAFYYCSALVEIEFKAGGSKDLVIADGAFDEVTQVEKITLPARLTEISFETLDALPALKVINVEADGAVYGSVDGLLTNGEQDTILYCPVGRTGAITLPAGVVAISDGAFAARKGITSVTIPSWVTSVGVNAFADCAGLTSVTVACGGVNDLTIGRNAFLNCAKLSKVTFGSASAASDFEDGKVIIGESAFENNAALTTLSFENDCNVTEIGTNAFKNCAKLSEIKIPAATGHIGDSAFEGCSQVSKVSFAENGVEITFGNSVFAGCSKLKTIHLPSTLVSFQSAVFEGCNGIVEITVDADNPVLVAEDGVLYNKAKTEVIYFPRAKEVNFSALPATLTKIGDAAFQGNYVVTEIEIPATITEIGAHAFDGCLKLSKVTFAGKNDIQFGAYAFANCIALKEMTLPASVTAISDHMFDRAALESVSIPASVKTIGAYAYANTLMERVEIPADVVSIGDAAFYNCDNLVSFTAANGADMTIGTLDASAVGTFAGSEKLATVALGNRVTLLGTNTFKGLNTALTSVTFGNSSKLKTIGDYAFASTSALTQITLPEGLETIGASAFRGCALSEIVIPGTVTTIGEFAFAESAGFASENCITFTASSTPLEIQKSAFNKCSNLVSIELPARLAKIFENTTEGSSRFPMTSFYTVFDGCTALKAINVDPACKFLSSIDGIVYLNDDNGVPVTLLYCPRGNTGDENGTVTVPSTVTLVANAAFYNTKVTNIVFEDIENWDGTPTLEIGTNVTAAFAPFLDGKYAVFGSSATLQNVDFPVQLKAIYLYGFYANTYSTGVNIDFDLNSAPVVFGNFAIYGQNMAGVSTLTLPRIQSLGNYAFGYNSKLTKVVFHPDDNTLTTLPTYVFYYCAALTEVLDIPASVTSVGNSAFFYDTNLTTITWKDANSLESIGNSSFGMTKIKEFTFSDNLKSIGVAPFNSCNALEKVTLSKNMANLLTSSGAAIFQGNSTIKEVIIPEGNDKLVSVGGAIYSSDKSILMYVPPKMDVTDFEILDTVTVLEQSALCYYAGTELVLPEGLIKISTYALYNIQNVETLIIPASVREIANDGIGRNAFKNIIFAEGSALETIGSSAFAHSDAVLTISIPDSVKEIGASAFAYCDVLETVVLPSSLTVLNSSVFSGCPMLKNVTMYEGITKIDAEAFADCTSLETITIPASVTEMVNGSWTAGAFTGCTALKSVIFAEGSKLNYIAYDTFENCTALESVTLPETLVSIPDGLFESCDALTNVEILGDVEELPANIFAGKANLTKVVLPETIKKIGAGAFDGCVNLTEINIPEGVESFGEAAFRDCAALTSISFGSALTEIGNYAFDGCTALAEVVFDASCNLKSLGTDPAVESAIFRNTAITSVVLPQTVAFIGGNVFENTLLTAIELPSTLEIIGNSAFAGCVNLTKVDIPTTVVEIGDYAFKDCSAVTAAEIGFGVESIGVGAFMNCVELQSVSIPASVNTIAGNPFINCPKLSDFGFDESNTNFVLEDGVLFDADKTTLIYYMPSNTAETYTVPATVHTFAIGAFYGSQLKSFTVPTAVSEIPSMLFMDSKNLESVTIPNSVIEIGTHAFEGCSALTTVSIPASVALIDDAAFANCTALAEVELAQRLNPVTFGEGVFDGCTALDLENLQ